MTPNPKRTEATTAFFELVLRPTSGATEVKSHQDIWKGPTWTRAIFGAGEADEATRWTLEDMNGFEAYFPAYTYWHQEQNAAVVKFTTSVADLLLCPVQPSFAVTSQKLGTVHAVWLLSSRVRRPFGASLADALARRLGGKEHRWSQFQAPPTTTSRVPTAASTSLRH
jgi:hypothetical protein